MKLIIITLFIGLIISPSINASTTTIDYSYRGGLKYYDHISLGKLGDKDAIIAGSDNVLLTDMCNEKSDFFCFFSIRYAFSVPKNLIAQKSWVVENVEFKVVENNISYSILGNEYNNLYLIQTPASGTLVGRHTGESTFWLYSKKYGLLGFSQQKDRITHWLQQQKGFGHIN